MAAPISYNTTRDTGIAALIQASNNKSPGNETTTSIFGEDGFTFGDIIDIVNPLQHIPIVSNIYRKITGDTIAPAMEIAGGALFGGPLGAAISIVSTVFQSQMQNNTDDSTDPDSPYAGNEATAIASNTPEQFSNTISANDYSTTDDLEILETNQASDNPTRNNFGGWVLNSDYFNKTENSHASINNLKNKHVYQAADGIVNLAYKKTEIYTDAITSTKSPEKTIDIIIGATSGAG